MDNGVSIVTPTSDRPLAFAHCAEYVERFARPAGPIEWVVVDDGETPTIPPIIDGISNQVVRLKSADSPRESFRANYLAAFAACTHDRIVIVEDDDWYHPDHLVLMAALLDYKPLCGARFARFYNVRYRCWKLHGNAWHSSLAQTGFRKSVLGDKVIEILQTRSTPEQLDGHLWRRADVPDHMKLLLPETRHHVSIKGMPGKFGMGVGHTRQNMDDEQYEHDPGMHTLRFMIGDVDANRYVPYFEAQASGAA